MRRQSRAATQKELFVAPSLAKSHGIVAKRFQHIVEGYAPGQSTLKNRRSHIRLTAKVGSYYNTGVRTRIIRLTFKQKHIKRIGTGPFTSLIGTVCTGGSLHGHISRIMPRHYTKRRHK